MYIKLKEKLNQVCDNVMYFTNDYSKEYWNFFTNATSENKKRYVNSIEEFITFLCNNHDLEMILEEYNKFPNKFKTEEQKILSRIKNLKNVYASNSQIRYDYVNSMINTEMLFINDRVDFNNKYATTSHLADLAEHETSLSGIINLQNLFFSPVPKYTSSVLETLRLRNTYFVERGFSNYLDYFCKSKNTTEKKIRSLMNKVDILTLDSYKKIKSNLESILEKKMKCHFNHTPSYIYGDPFFRFYPVHIDENINILFKGKDVAYAARKFFEYMGVNIDEIFETSDLYVRPGKYQSNFIVDLNRESDVRFSVNSKSNYRGMYHLLRTLSNVIFTLNYDKSLPFILRTIPNRGLSEGFGMFLADYAFRSGFISRIIAQYEEEDDQSTVNVSDYLNNNRITYIRFFLALAEFELQINSSMDIDYSSLWLKAVKKYQLISADKFIEKNGWVMLDSIIIDPFSSVFELEGFLYVQQIEKHIPEKVTSSRYIMNHLLNSVVSKCTVPN
ncbi:MAG: hypothetical protein COX48_05115 [bacterium (Candidatus Stahlbacteria) CG23_combo_of_CG06-09_8_20_14_all_34_7]|nr:MAG: hypothetical protein COX48_05115 [bacterium (Candidatus Stahlbacteria) CG23_combo_of_CG06-09_8_20_14_all_34_7]